MSKIQLGTKEQNRANLIFDRWKAELKNMDRSRANVYNNFELLFDKIWWAISKLTLESSSVTNNNSKLL